MKTFDGHAHIFKEYWNEEERTKIFNKVKEEMEFIIIPGTEESSSKEIVQYKGDNRYIAVGLHPNVAHSIEVVEFMNDFDYSEITAIGEVGLDLHWKENPPIETQVEVLRYQMDIAKKHNIPVIVHSREADEHMYKIIESGDYDSITIILHSYASDKDWTKKYLEFNNVVFSFSGTVTFKNAHQIRESLELIPMDRVLSETDSPYLSPHPFRGQENKPWMVEHVVNKIAEVKGLTVDEANEIILSNAKRIYKIA